MKTINAFFLILCTLSSFAQKKVMDHDDVNNWNTIKDQSISSDGNFVMYALEKGEKDHHLKIKDSRARKVFDYQRGTKGKFTSDSQFAVFTIKAWQDSVKAMKRRKVKKNKLPKDSIGIYNLVNSTFAKIANVKSYKLPEEWSGHVGWLLDAGVKVKKKVKNTGASGDDKTPKKSKKAKKPGKKNGYHLVLRNLSTAKQDTFKFITHYTFAKAARRLAFATTGLKGETEAGVYVFNLNDNVLTHVFSASEKAKYYQLNFSESGKKLGFVADTDTSKVQIRPYELHLWSEGAEKAEKLLDAASAPEGYQVSQHGKLHFSKDGSKMFFGLATPPIVKDTTLLKEEIVNVEVWTYDEPRLYTVQEKQVENDKKKAYTAVIQLNNNNKLVQLATTAWPDVELGDEGNAGYALAGTDLPYQLERQWEGRASKDYALVNTATGEVVKALTKISGQVKLSPSGKYVYGYHLADSTWFTYGIATGKYTPLTKGKVFYREIHDAPTYPNAYGATGWTSNDAAILIYDRYDIWSFNPDSGAATRLTKGREKTTRYRYVKLDKEERTLNDEEKWLLTAFNETDKTMGYYEFNPKNNRVKQLVAAGPYAYSNPVKAKKDDAVIFTRQNFREFPNIRYSGLNFKRQTLISNANPQQDQYNWGTIELVKWTSLDGMELTGMLVKPENFDPSRKYPMIVNFYERSSNGLHRHSTPANHRSTINYSFYASRGYLIFNPDVHYRIGYPGESAYNCVIPGVTALIEKGFVDKDNIGVQGHSWGGYQIAYLVTKTNIFKAAEAGAPVPNMISAYGGIRWQTGLSRQFQYEHTQSRIGGTPWEYPVRYIENSPIFNIDKIHTPLLIMHNDNDGHVPWYQGIELFVSLRRLGKPSWFLNYNGEPHWPLKLRNRKDFNIRMAQFFDHYLKGAPKPMWMKRGIPAIEKGIKPGFEPAD